MSLVVKYLYLVVIARRWSTVALSSGLEGTSREVVKLFIAKHVDKYLLH